jgi:hypothetical protein
MIMHAKNRICVLFGVVLATSGMTACDSSVPTSSTPVVSPPSSSHSKKADVKSRDRNQIETLSSRADFWKVGNISFDHSINPNDVNLLADDLVQLKVMPFERENERLAQIMRLENSEPSSLVGWLERRIKVILNEGYDPANPATPTGYTFADNYGGTRYRNAILAGQPFPVAQVSGIGSIEIYSPRVGLFRIGPVLIPTSLNSRHTSFSGRVFRLSVLFHEARHSDGNGPTLTMPHGVCPAGYDIVGRVGCDLSLNGPYAVEREFLTSVAASCVGCMTSDREAIRLYMLYAASRIAGDADVDDEPEGVR